MNDELIENRFLFKKVAKHIAEKVILQDQYPGECKRLNCQRVNALTPSKHEIKISLGRVKHRNISELQNGKRKKGPTSSSWRVVARNIEHPTIFGIFFEDFF